MVDGRCCFTPPTASSHLVRFALSYFSQILSEVARKENTKDRPSFILFSFGSIHSIRFRHRYIQDRQRTADISYSSPLIFSYITQAPCSFSCFFISFGCLLYVLNAPDFGASITKVLEDLIPATLDSYLQRRRGGTGRQDYTHTHTDSVVVCVYIQMSK